MKMISIKEGLPAYGAQVLVYDELEGYALAELTTINQRSYWASGQPCGGQECDPMLDDVTHWGILPAKPNTTELEQDSSG